jgi:hypothetical protein
MRLPILALLCLALLTSLGRAEQAPLPAELMHAKTVYVQKGQTYPVKRDPSGNASYVEPCVEELGKWGRFQVVSDAKAADLIFRISTRQQTSYMMINNQTRNSVDGFTFLEVVEPSSGKTLWWVRQNWATSWSTKTATKSLVKQLRKHVEEQEMAEGKAK